MPVTLTALTELAELGFDEIIDVRSPSEFAEDHLPGAINLPVLDDAERSRVGTIYKQQSPFLARKVGAALLARNAARHLEGPLADKSGGWRPLVYCWRGGQRSGGLATILGHIGWRVDTVAGGYQSWRRLVVRTLYDSPVPAAVMVLDGNTGTAKTEVLHLLGQRGVQVIDLEGLANHRGSLFGARPGGQPSQKAFEGRLALQIADLDPSRPVLVEAESSKIGNCRIPPQLWKAMLAAPRICIEAPRAARARYLAQAYADLVADPVELGQLIDKLRPLQPGRFIERWHALADAGEFVALADELMEHHYDPRYAKQRSLTEARPPAVVQASDLATADLAELADRLLLEVTGGR